MTPDANPLSKLTTEQQDLLRLIVEKYPVNKPTQFIVSRNVQTSALGYGHTTFRITADDTDFSRLEREDLITLSRNHQGLLCGKPTRRGITVVEEARVGSYGGGASPAAASASTGKAGKPILAVDIVAGHDRSPSSVEESIFHREGAMWTLSFQGKITHIPNMVGLGYIAELLRTPRLAVEATQLNGASVEASGLAALRGIPLADAATIQAVRSELAKREGELAGLGKRDWLKRGELEKQIAQLKKYLGQVEAQHGQARKVAGTAERSRTAVTNAINRAIVQISEQHPDLGCHLKESIRTGTAPIYEPAEVPDWRF